MNCQKTGLIEVIFKVWKGPEKVKFGGFATFCQFSQKRSDNLSLFLVNSFLGMILINCQEMDWSGLVHFPLIIDIIQ